MKILVPVDGSDASLKAVRVAMGLLDRGLAADLVLANVQESANLYEIVTAPDPEVLERVRQAAGIDMLASAEALLMDAGIVYEREVAVGDPAHTIVDIAERYGCELIILGSRGASGFRSAMLGSVSNEVLHAAHVSVMIVKPDEEPDQDEAA